MFSPLGLFKQTPCPEYPHCSLTNCLFAHDESLNSKQYNGPPTKSASAHNLEDKEDLNGSDVPRKRRRIGNTVDESGSPAVKAVAVRASLSSESPPAVSKASAKQPPASDTVLPSTASRPISPPPLRAAKASYVRPNSPQNGNRAREKSEQTWKDEDKSLPKTTQLPTAKKSPLPKRKTVEESLNPRMLPNPPVSHPIRMKLLTMLHEQMTRLNAELMQSEDASKAALKLSDAEIILEALDEEVQMAKRNPRVYQNVIKSRIMVLRKMKVDVWKQERIKKVASKVLSQEQKKPGAPKPIDTGLTSAEEVALVPRLAAHQEGLKEHGYIVTKATDAELEAARRGLESSHGWEQCDRCTTRFQVFPSRRTEDGALTSGGKCTYHWAKPRRPNPTMSENKNRDMAYACCDQSVGVSSGCTQAHSHVFKISDPKRLAMVMPFERTPTSNRENLPGAVCFDCEMGYTTMGMELIRLTATAWPDGREVLDVLVRPLGEVLDLNSRFSGVWPDDYTNAVSYNCGVSQRAKAGDAPAVQIVDSPAKARELLFELITLETPLIGHALENDLNAARILHPVIVDSCLLFPHPRGLPLRFGLKMLMKKHLDREIQMGGAQGHDSKEDARAAGDLVRVQIGQLWQRMKGEGWTKSDGEFYPPLPQEIPPNRASADQQEQRRKQSA
ncbi:MAG: hypothetical protein Q9222_007214 [Ikaeria aurantiellina]